MLEKESELASYNSLSSARDSWTQRRRQIFSLISHQTSSLLSFKYQSMAAREKIHT